MKSKILAAIAIASATLCLALLAGCGAPQQGVNLDKQVSNSWCTFSVSSNWDFTDKTSSSNIPRYLYTTKDGDTIQVTTNTLGTMSSTPEAMFEKVMPDGAKEVSKKQLKVNGATAELRKATYTKDSATRCEDVAIVYADKGYTQVIYDSKQDTHIDDLAQAVAESIKVK